MNQLNFNFEDLIKNKKLTFLAGAGCSVKTPSNLPAGKEMMEAITRFSCHEELLNNISQILKDGKIRFESLMEIFQDLLDKELKSIEYFSLCDKPNFLHFFLAKMILEGHFVMTTNFDSLIEYALLHLDIPKESVVPVITKEDFKNYKNPNELYKQGKKPVYKIHGSPNNIIRKQNKLSLKKSLIVTISSLGRGKKGLNLFELEPEKIPLFHNILDNRSLVVLGYSGSDDFDIIPTLKIMKKIHEIIWINHDNTTEEEVNEINEEFIQNTQTLNKTDDILIDFKRSNKDIKIYKVKGNTSKIIENSFPIKPEISKERFTLDPFDWLKSNVKKPSEIEQFQMCYRIFYDLGLIDEALSCAENINSIADKINDNYWKSVSNNNLGAISRLRGNIDVALKYYKKALKLIEKDENLKNDLVYLTNNIGVLYRDKGELDKALKYYEEALKYSKELNEKKLIGYQFNNIGVIYRIKGNLKKALEYFNSALSIFDDIGFYYGISMVFLNIAGIFRIRRKFDKELEYVQKALKINKLLGSLNGLHMCYNALGVIYSEKGNFDKALKNLNKAYELSEKLGDKKAKATVLRNYGTICSKRGNFKQALGYYKQALEIDRSLNFKQGISINLENIGSIYESKEDYKRAVNFFKQALYINQELGNQEKIENNYKSIGLLCYKMKDFDEAGNYYQKALSIIDELDYIIAKGDLLLNRSLLYIELNNFSYAKSDLTKAERIFRELEINNQLVEVYRNYGKLSKKQGNKSKSIYYLKKALQFSKKTEEKRKTAIIFNEIGEIHKEMGKIKISIKYFENAHSITEEINDFFGKAKILFNMSNAYCKQGKKSSNLRCLRDALNSLKKINQENSQLAKRIKKRISFVRNQA